MSKEYAERVKNVIEYHVENKPESEDQELIDMLTKGVEGKFFVGAIRSMVTSTRKLKKTEDEVIGNIHDNPELLEVSN